MTKTEELLYNINKRIDSLKIAWYIKEEVIASIKYLHWYKLKNIDKNMDSFCEYLMFLNYQNTEKINNICENKWWNKDNKNKDLSYFFVPEKKLNKEKEKDYIKKLSSNWYELLTLVQWVKGILVLSIDEFCNASKTRMDIHNLLMNRETEFKHKCHTKTKK
jgi:hypothetical protein